MKKYIIILLIFLLFGSNVVSATNEWNSNNSIVNGLNDIGWGSTPTVFYKDGGWKLISGEEDTGFYGFEWNGNTWINNTNIVSGLIIDSYLNPAIFYKDNQWELITSSGFGDMYSYSWNGTAWINNNSVINGLTSIDADEFSPVVFYKDGGWELIAGDYGGNWYGYDWNGSTWINSPSIITGLNKVTEGSNSPSIFYKDDKWNIIYGTWEGNFYGYKWNGSTWISNLSMVSGLNNLVMRSNPTVFYKNNQWLLIAGNESGNFYGYSNAPSLIFNSLSISPSTILQFHSTQITAWITGVSDTSSVTATAMFPSSSTMTLPLSYIGSDLYVGTFTQTNEHGRYYVTNITADSTFNFYGLSKSFLVNPIDTGGSTETGVPTPTPTVVITTFPTPTPTPIVNVNNTFILPDFIRPLLETLPTSVKQIIAYTLTPSLYAFDLLFILLILILLSVITNYKITIGELVFFTLVLFIILRLIGINLTTIITGVT